MSILSFDEAWPEGEGRLPYLLLGNGFSIALKPDIFTYGSLFEKADFSSAPKVPLIFKALDTTDFEIVIKHLLNSARILDVYDSRFQRLATKLKTDADLIKNILVEAIATGHPSRPFEIADEEYKACRKFLARFTKIYSLNYDVLLYWTLMQSELDEITIKCDDGFRHPENDDEPYVSWQDFIAPNVFYLHGALHLFDARSEIIKYTWSKTETPIIEQIRSALDQERYPLFVAEGDHESKEERILHNAYLHKAFRSFQQICGQKKGILVIFGHSLASNDWHILREVTKGKISDVLISIFGDPESAGNLQIRENARKLEVERTSKQPGYPLNIIFFDAKSANVWTPT